jgi:CSLREA domain-containing protein
MYRRRNALAAVAVVIASFAFAASASAATVHVNTTVDENFVTNGSCSLREAIAATNADLSSSDCPLAGVPGADAIILDLPDSTLNLTNVGDGELLVTDTGGLTIAGPGMNFLTINAAPNERVIESTGGVPMSINGLKIENGNFSDVGTAGGGGISAGGNLSLIDVKVADNTATATTATGNVSAVGGGVYVAAGTLTVSNSVIANNTATASNSLPDDGVPATGNDVNAQGGGVFGNAVTISNSTISGNTASGTDDHGTGDFEGVHVSGGGIASPDLTLTRSTVSDNHLVASAPEDSASAWGGGILSNGTGSIELSTIAGNTISASGLATSPLGAGIKTFGTLTLRSDTIAGNGPLTGGMPGANLSPAPGTMTLKNTIVDNPIGTASTNCGSAVTSSGFNIDSGTSCGLDPVTIQTDQEGVSPMLGALADNGGPTDTMLPGTTSPAIDKGSAASQADPTHDQRGLTRPVNSATVTNVAGGDGSDIGAVEAQAPPAPAVFGTSPSSPEFNDVSPEVTGATFDGPSAAEDPTSVNLFSDSGCITAVSTTSDDPTDFTGGGITALLSPNTTTTLFANTSNDYGISSPCSSSFASYTLDSLGPVMTIDPGPADATDHTPTFTFHGTDASMFTTECSVDGAAFSPCLFSYTSAPLGNGLHSFQVQGTDSLGTGGAPATRAFTISTPTVTPPVTTPTPTPPVTTPAPKKKKCKKAKKGSASAAKKCKKHKK